MLNHSVVYCLIVLLYSPPSPRGGASPVVKPGQPAAASMAQRAAPNAPSRPAPSVPSRGMGPSPTPVGNSAFNLPAPLIPT